MNKEITNKIIDDAREGMASFFAFYLLEKNVCKNGDDAMKMGNELAETIMPKNKLALSGTTDIGCEACEGRGWHPVVESNGGTGYASNIRCSKCDNGVIKHPWKVRVVLENGEHLPSKRCAFVGKTSVYDSVYGEVFQGMKDAGYVQEVRQVVE